ncbi:efflux transporter, RND family, MFP subunit [Chloroherpeton thalassium ATCC 35110]|uniref:Efflux transporter, RND family, MFP subunit n=1 Tax=Chloroherpeton thalassium (strain ATCC 35110 / GB-78) TaxID=517418 RepID=B3QV21_CHLT3|nr:efflux RND transporter periplasmic adaptor subunit [Chloroherpeton thalassium]ACF12975.1 efflux transporter, RND family, MFP subunit [Chloroherpeton thalassium ATCC 35110]
MSQKIIVLGVLLLIVVGGALWFFVFRTTNTETAFNLARLERGDVENTVSCTGTISPLSEVEVGTQTSGIIKKIYTDFNQEVKKDQLLAVLDTELLKASLLSAEANLEKSEAELEQAELDYARNKKLYEGGFLAEADFLPYKIDLKTAKASVKTAQSTVAQAQQNMHYAYIRSPINGTVIEKDVEEGQTVAASYSTPTLFVIAEDLSKIQIEAEVDESDIGSIKEGQPVRFEVPAYTNMSFTGTVFQIRLQPEVTNNVVNYTVIIYADNKDDILLPGMTCTVDFIIEAKKDVLKVPNSALNFNPDQALAFSVMEKKREQMPDSLKRAPRPDFAGGTPPQGQMPSEPPAKPADAGMIWFINSSGELDATPVKTGISDGSYTVLENAGSLKEGTEVVTGLLSATASSKSSDSDSRRKSGFGGGPPPF